MAQPRSQSACRSAPVIIVAYFASFASAYRNSELFCSLLFNFRHLKISELSPKWLHWVETTQLSIHHFAKASLMWFDGGDATPRNSYPFYEALETLFRSHEWHEVRRIAKIHAQSGPRSRVLRTERREIDWALLGVMQNDNFSFGLGEHIMFRHKMALETERQNELKLQPSKPGAFVRSLGRTSGHQIGRISTPTSAIFHGAYTTQEWTVIKRRETPLNDWVEGGIEVEGDSGALIVDEKTEAVYGVVWGRSGDGPATVTIFTPMQDILEDIQERAKTDQVQLLRGQQMPRPEKAENL